MRSVSLWPAGGTEPGRSVIIIIIIIITGPNENSQKASNWVNVLAPNSQDEVYE